MKSSGGGKALQPTILGMATGNPPYACSQEQALAVAQKVPGIDSVQPVLGRIYGNSRIHNRYMSVPDFTPEQQLEGDEMFFNPDMKFQMPVETRFTLILPQKAQLYLACWDTSIFLMFLRMEPP